MKFVSRTGFHIVTLVLAGAAVACATPCGTVASNSCAITVNGNLTYTFSNFLLGAQSAGGGANLYEADDINIDVASGGGGTGLLTFTKNPAGSNAGVVFLVNPNVSPPNQFSGFGFTYDVTITPAVPGSVIFSGDTTTGMIDTHTNGGFVTVQTVQEGAAPPGCQLFTGTTFDTCALPPGTTTFLEVGNIVSLNSVGGGATPGNASIVSFTNLFAASFSPGAAAVPEPSSFALLGLGLVAVGLLRRKRLASGLPMLQRCSASTCVDRAGVPAGDHRSRTAIDG